MAAWKKIVQHDTDATLTTLNASGNITADTFTGDGSGLTNIAVETQPTLEIAQNVIIEPQSFETTLSTDDGGSQDDWLNGPGTSTAFSYDGWSTADDGETPSGTTGAQHGGIHARVVPNMKLYPWGSGNGGGAPGAFVYTEASSHTNELHQIRTPFITIPDGHQARFVMYIFSAGSNMGTLKLKHTSNATNGTGGTELGFRYFNKYSQVLTAENTSISGTMQEFKTLSELDNMTYAEQQEYKAWQRVEAVVPSNGFVYIDFTTGPGYSSDFCIDNAYVVSTEAHMDSGTPDGYDANVMLQTDADLMIDVGMRTYENDYTATKILVKATDDVHFKGDVVAYSSTISDERLKENILPITNSLSVIKNLQGVSYDWKYKPTTRQVGLLAQQVESQIPEVVKEYDLPFTGGPKSDTPYKTVSYQLLVPHLIESIKELNARIEDLESLLDK
jgi:hypothetical protein